MNTPQIPPERWIANLLEAARLISDRDYQERRWLADDALAWETPDEAINMLDDSVLNGFIEQFGNSFSPVQANTAVGSVTRSITIVKRLRSTSNRSESLLIQHGKRFARRRQISFKPSMGNGQTARPNSYSECVVATRTLTGKSENPSKEESTVAHPEHFKPGGSDQTKTSVDAACTAPQQSKNLSSST
jgi:hypothetical protein